MRKKNLNPDFIYFENYNEDYRDLYRLVALFGCFSGSDIDKGIAFPLLHRADGKSFIRKSTYSTKIKQLTYLLSDKYLKASEGASKSHFLDSDIYTNKADLLHKTYKMHNFTQGQLMQFFIILQAAQSYMKEMGTTYFSLNGLATFILDKYEDNLDCVSEPFKQLISDIQKSDEFNQSKPFRNVFDGMITAGYIQHVQSSKAKEDLYDDEIDRSYYYTIPENKLDSLSDNQLDCLYRLLNHLAKTAPIKIPYYLARERLLTYSCVSGREINSGAENILFRHNFSYPVLDDIITIDLLRALKKNRSIKIIYKYTSQNYSDDDTYVEKEMIVQPIRIVQNNEDGRQFLFCYTQEQRYESIRLDYILKVQIIKKKVQLLSDVQFSTALKELTDHVWCASPYRFMADLKELKIEFKFDEKDAFYRNRMFTALSRFEIEETEKNVAYTATVQVYDTKELTPWIASFGSKVSILSEKTIDVQKTENTSISIPESLEFEEPELSLFNYYDSFVIDILLRYFAEGMDKEDLVSEFNKQFGKDADKFYDVSEKDNFADYYGLFKVSNTDNLEALFDEPVPVVLNTIEQEAVVNALKSPIASMYFTNEGISKISSLFNIEATWSSDYVLQRFEGKNTYRENIQNTLVILISSLLNHSLLLIDNLALSKTYINQKIFPLRLEFTPKLNIWTLTAYSFEAERFINMNINRLENIRIIRPFLSPSEVANIECKYKDFIQIAKKRTVSIRLSAKNYDVDRFFRLFSFYNRITKYNKKDSTYQVILQYYAFDELQLEANLNSFSAVLSTPVNVQ